MDNKYAVLYIRIATIPIILGAYIKELKACWHCDVCKKPSLIKRSKDIIRIACEHEGWIVWKEDFKNA